MKKIFFVVLVFLISFCVNIAMKKVVFPHLTNNSTTYIYEGLPHQVMEKPLYEEELKRHNVILLNDFAFYTPKRQASQKESISLINILNNPSNFQPYSGAKLCGGFHPDYAVSWNEKNNKYYAFLCFGCSEVVFVSRNKTIKYDLPEPYYKKLQGLLRRYRLKRPDREVI